jgi:hypothetical protein
MIVPKIDPPTIRVPWFSQGFQLAQQCLYRSGFAYVSGPQGTGKAKLGEHIDKEWKRHKLPGQVHFLMGDETKILRLARMTYETIVGMALEPRPRRTECEIRELIIDNLATKEASLLYVDGIVGKEHPGLPFFLKLLHGAQDRRVPVGMMLTTWSAPLTLFELEQNPGYLGTLRFPHLEEHQVVDVMAKWVPAFKDVAALYYKNDAAARDIAKIMFRDTKGNFDRLVGFWRMAMAYGPEHLLCPKRICTLTGEHRRVFAASESSLVLEG